jgi:hypothetical protein
VRYYRIIITNDDGSIYRFKSLGTAIDPPSTLSSLLPGGPQNPAYGLTNPAALQIELDLPVSSYGDPTGNALLTIHNLGIVDVSSAADLAGLNIQIFGGMAKGLPLANPAQAGLLFEGHIFTSWGMWFNERQCITLNMTPGLLAANKKGPAVGSPNAPQNFPVAWKTGTPLGQAIAQTLSIAMPGMAQNINISPNIVLNHDSAGQYQSLTQFAEAVDVVARSILGAGYPGISVYVNGGTITVADMTATANVIKIAPQDIIGQPTWVQFNQISVQLVMRADIHNGDTITLPAIVVQTGSGARSAWQNIPANKLTFSGNFVVQQLRHLGNFRQEDGEAWNTTYTCNVASA